LGAPLTQLFVLKSAPPSGWKQSQVVRFFDVRGSAAYIKKSVPLFFHCALAVRQEFFLNGMDYN
jgi:hypothetical protein